MPLYRPRRRLGLTGGALGWTALAVTACVGGGASPDAPGFVPEASQGSSEVSVEASYSRESFTPNGSDDATLVADAQGPDRTLDEDGIAWSDVVDGAIEDSAAQADGQPDVDAQSDDSPSPMDSQGAAACVTAGTELCDDFESGTLDAKVWQTRLGGPAPSVTVDMIHAHSGKYSVHARVTPGQQSTAQITESLTFPALDDTFYTRIWAYFSPAVAWPANPPDFHTGFIIAGGNNDLGHVELAVGANLSPSSAAGPMHYLGYSIYRGPPYVEFGPRSPTPVTSLAWTCIELMESGRGGMAAVRRIWVDDAELPEQYGSFGLAAPMGQKPPAFDLVSIGIWEYHPTPSLSDMWIDDVRVSHQRIGCAS